MWDVLSTLKKIMWDVLSTLKKNHVGRFVHPEKMMLDILFTWSENGMGRFVRLPEYDKIMTSLYVNDTIYLANIHYHGCRRRIFFNVDFA